MHTHPNYAGIGAVVVFINAALVAYLTWFIWKHFAAADRKAEKAGEEAEGETEDGQAGEEGQAGDREGEEVQEGPNRVSENGQHAGGGSKSPSPSPSPSRGRGLFGMVRKGGMVRKSFNHSMPVMRMALPDVCA